MSTQQENLHAQLRRMLRWVRNATFACGALLLLLLIGGGVLRLFHCSYRDSMVLFGFAIATLCMVCCAIAFALSLHLSMRRTARLRGDVLRLGSLLLSFLLVTTLLWGAAAFTFVWDYDWEIGEDIAGGERVVVLSVGMLATAHPVSFAYRNALWKGPMIDEHYLYLP